MLEVSITPDLSYADAVNLLTKLERHPDLLGSHWLTLEQMIAACMELTFKATDPKVKMYMAAVEYRARLLRERAKVARN